jgi:phosphatidylglycerol:prolipoprotein diacylglycerol transferase
VIVSIDPVILTIGPYAVRWFGVLALVGLGLATWLSLRDLDARAVSRGRALDALAWGLPGGLIVARLVHVLGWWDYYLTHSSELWQLNLDGLSLWGGLLGGLAFAAARLKLDTARRRMIFDVMAPNVALGIAVGRLGAFLDGQGQGLSSSLPWATQYTNPLAATPDFGVPRHPAQVYDGLVALALFGVLRALPLTLPPGTRLATFFVVYGASRLALGAVRLDPAFLFGLQIDQILALAAIAFGVVYGLRPVVQQRRARRAPAAAAQQSARPAEDSVAA